MAVLFTILKFAALLLLSAFVIRFILVGIIGSSVYLILYRKVLKRKFDPEQQAIITQLCGLPTSAILISVGSIRALEFLHFGHAASLAFFVLLIVEAIRDYADDAISSVARSFPGFVAEMLVYFAFIVKLW